MRSNPLGAVLVTLLFMAALGTAWLSVRYLFATRELQRLQAAAASMNGTLSAAQMLANEAVEYSRHNPAIDPILQQYELKAKPAASPGPVAPKPGK